MAETSNLYDVIVVGGGPAGLTAALYLARARYRVLVVEKDHFGGQITITSEVVNYPGVVRCSGKELTEDMRRQALSFGAEFLLAEVERLSLDGDVKSVVTDRGTYSCFGVLLATGAHPRMVGFSGEEEYKGRGVAYCATCDGEFFTGKDVFVLGGGFAAAEESVFLTRFARHVTILIRGNDFSCAEATAEEARTHEKITVLTHKTVEEVSGTEEGLNYLRYRDTQTGEVTEFRAAPSETFGVFVFAGYEPATGLVKGTADLDPQGYILTDRNQKTSAEGLYAAGDVCVKSLRQVVTAVGDGALAATELERYAASLHEKTGLTPKKPGDVTRTTKAGADEGSGHAHTPSATHDVAQGALFDDAMLAQLQDVFGRMESPLTLELSLDDTGVAEDLSRYMKELAGITDKLTVKVCPEEGGVPPEERPCVRILREDGSYSGLAFHGAPGGHEFTSFVLGLYNAAGPGQAVDEASAKAIAEISVPVKMKVMVSLSCTMCPGLVTAAQRIAAGNDLVTAEVYDLNNYPALRDRYKVMSVPCLVINDSEVTFGKKGVAELLGIIRKAAAG